jgi:hypothetical protein
MQRTVITTPPLTPGCMQPNPRVEAKVYAALAISPVLLPIAPLAYLGEIP